LAYRSRNTIGISTLTTLTVRRSTDCAAPALARAEQGYEIDQIANDIGMSRQNVVHYMRFRDQMKVGADGQKRLLLIGKEG
jgi:predicted transcriptional regulator